ncbi:MAG: BamA/TamA family outer membrane protein, partial [Pseudomonadota bacterium]
LLGDTSLVDDTGIDGETSQLLAIPAFAAYDDTDSLLDPTRGQRLRISGGPWGGAWRGDGTAWLQTDLSGSVYRRLDADGRFVAAARARFGSILGPELARVPPPRRFYAGGGGSVRGLRKDFVGRVDGRNSPVGGLSAVETNAEMRARVWGPVSAVAFVDAGLVDPDPAPDVSQAWQLGAGLGARYASPIGPVRLDVGFPLRRRRPDDDFQVYFSIGQAF